MQPTAPTPRTSKIWNLIEINMNIDLGVGQAAFRNKNQIKIRENQFISSTSILIIDFTYLIKILKYLLFYSESQ